MFIKEKLNVFKVVKGLWRILKVGSSYCFFVIFLSP